LLEANKEAFDLIVQGIEAAGDPDKHDGREKSVAVIDFDHPERNDFIAINQFRADVPGGKTFISPDIVLFVNGIPLVVVECKSPKISYPMEEGINQLLRYSNQRQEVEEDEGCERRPQKFKIVMVTDRINPTKGLIRPRFRSGSLDREIDWPMPPGTAWSSGISCLEKRRISSS